MGKVIIAVMQGCASVIEKPDDVIVELRDYDVLDDSSAELQLDEDGQQYLMTQQ